MYALWSMPPEKTLLSYVGSLTIARISPVCGFMTMITARFRLAAFIPQWSAFSASSCTLVSIVSRSELPATGWRSVLITWMRRPDGSVSTSWRPYMPRSCSS